MSESTIVIDNGSHSVRAGMAGAFEPQYVSLSQVARFQVNKKHTQVYCCKEVARAPKGAEVKQVLLDPCNVDWPGVEKMWRHIAFEKLQVSRDAHRYFLTEPPHNSNANRGKALEIMFESCQASGVFFGFTPNMILYASGRTTGVGVDSGYLATHVCPIFEGFMLPLNHKKLGYGGATVTQLLRRMLSKSGVDCSLSNCQYLKEVHCFVADEYYQDAEGVSPKTYSLPDGSSIEMGVEAYKSCELAFDPSVADLQDDQLPYAIYHSVSKCDSALRKKMFGNVVVGGGNSLLRGLTHRLEKGLVYLAPASMEVKVHASPQRKYASWTGASLLANQDQMKDVWIDKKVFDEFGANAVAVRCF